VSDPIGEIIAFPRPLGGFAAARGWRGVWEGRESGKEERRKGKGIDSSIIVEDLYSRCHRV